MFDASAAAVTRCAMALVMTMSPTAVRTARRNLVQRIDRFVGRIQTEGFQPGPDAIANFEVALERLERADYPSGEDAMIRGEYGYAPRSPRPADPPPIGKLIERFERLPAEDRAPLDAVRAAIVAERRQ